MPGRICASTSSSAPRQARFETLRRGFARRPCRQCLSSEKEQVIGEDSDSNLLDSRVKDTDGPTKSGNRAAFSALKRIETDATRSFLRVRRLEDLRILTMTATKILMN